MPEPQLFSRYNSLYYNNYAKKLAGLRPALYLVEAGLAVFFFVHIWLTVVVVIENRLARPIGYAMTKSVGKRSLATRLMPYTGTIIVAFVIWHLMDFTFSDHHGRSWQLQAAQSETESLQLTAALIGVGRLEPEIPSTQDLPPLPNLPIPEGTNQPISIRNVFITNIRRRFLIDEEIS